MCDSPDEQQSRICHILPFKDADFVFSTRGRRQIEVVVMCRHELDGAGKLETKFRVPDCRFMFLISFAKFQKAITSFVISVRPSVHTPVLLEQRVTH